MTKNDGGPAFPAHHYDLADNEHGMSLRDYLAAKALQGLCAAFGEMLPPWAENDLDVAEVAYGYADAMLEARAGRQNER